MRGESGLVGGVLRDRVVRPMGDVGPLKGTK